MVNQRFTRILAIAMIAAQLLTVPAFAREDVIPGSRYTAAREAALGGAFLPLGEDGPSALFSNPANVGKFKVTNIEPVNAAIYLNGPFFTTLGFNSWNIWSLAGLAPTLLANPTQAVGAGASFIPSFYTHFSIFSFALGVLLQSQVSAFASGGLLNVRSQYQFVPAASFGMRLADGILRLGYSFQWVNEAVGNQVNMPISSGWSSGLQQGSGFSHNVGISVMLPIATLPQFDLVARNILGTAYNMGSLIPFSGNPAAGAPPTEPMSFDGSFSIHPKFGKGTVLHVVAEIRDFTNSSNTGIFEKFAFGTEFIIRDFIFLRGGFGSGWPAAGFGVKIKTHELHLSWYSEELGKDWQQVRDMRFMFNYQFKVW